MWVAFAGPPAPFVLRSLHVGVAMALAFLMISINGKKSEFPSLSGVLLSLAALAAAGYPIVMQDYLYDRFIYVDPLIQTDWIFGVLIIVLILEATRRLIGPALPIVAIAFMIYGFFFAKITPEVVMEQVFITTEGIYGIPVAVSATYMVLFIIFGSLVDRMGIGSLFMDFAVALTGRSAGGPAKVAVVTSGLFGTVSGSAVANVMTTGTFTIPLMKGIGYRPAFAGAVEAVASTGGQIMPPIMGAAAFVMAEFLGVSYLTVASYAIIPAVLYYVAVFASVHFEARRLGIQGLPEDQIPNMWIVLRERGHLFLPLVVIIGVLLYGYSAAYAALCGVLSVIPTALLRKSTRHYVTLKTTYEAMVNAARNTLPIALACACAGIVVGVVDITGLGLSFANLVIGAAQEQLIFALLLTMVAGIILGMGMPTTPAYIVQVALLVPALVKLGVAVEAAHLFVFYFAILSAITPPVAMAVYAANAISKADIWNSSWAAVKLGLAGYIVPFMFVFGPALLMKGSVMDILTTFVTAVIGAICLAAALSGYFYRMASIVERLVLFVAAVVLINPGIITDAAGISLVIFVLSIQYLRRKKTEVFSDKGW
ncbi:MAG: TRAP transporter permease [Rhodospirillales bacterium]|nr:TRAP transporter permease [Rhodospirillales bacterium]